MTNPRDDKQHANAHHGDDPGYAVEFDDHGDIANADPLEIPIEALSPGALTGVIEAYVLREGTDYGLYENAETLEQKVERVRDQLIAGDARIVFDPNTETVHITVAVRKPKSWST